MKGSPGHFELLRSRRIGRGEALWAYGLSAPALLLMAMLLFLPVMAVIVIAQTDWEFATDTLSYVGIRNFTDLSSDPAPQKMSVAGRPPRPRWTAAGPAPRVAGVPARGACRPDARRSTGAS
jgi:ABC-type sugar transport system permease subunit